MIARTAAFLPEKDQDQNQEIQKTMEASSKDFKNHLQVDRA